MLNVKYTYLVEESFREMQHNASIDRMERIGNCFNGMLEGLNEQEVG
jgi:hypothetical protein